jgi:hypothetical protein
MNRTRAGQLRLLIAVPFLTEAVAHLSASEPARTKNPSAIVWTLDNLDSIGGFKPKLLGTPELSAGSDGSSLHFNGTNDGLLFLTNPITKWKAFTIEALFKPEADAPEAQRFLHIEDVRGGRVTLETRMLGTNSWCLDTYLLCGKTGLPLCDRAKLHSAGKWTWVALTYNRRRMSSYVNGVKELEGKLSFSPMKKGQMSLGVRLNQVYWFKGSIKEVRFTPAELPPPALQHSE